MDFGAALKQIRTDQRLTVEETASKLWTTPDFINKVESGEFKPLNRFAFLLCHTFGVKYSFFKPYDKPENSLHGLKSGKPLSLEKYYDLLQVQHAYLDALEQIDGRPPDQFLELVIEAFELPDDHFGELTHSYFEVDTEKSVVQEVSAEDYENTFGGRLRAVRNKLGVTVKTFAKKLGELPKDIEALEANRSIPTAECIKFFTVMLDLPTDYFSTSIADSSKAEQQEGI